jgi:L-alanine-DL-glutamate epimerase-like enolase superfamily enzyme
MQITKAEVTPIELKIKQPIQVARSPEIDRITVVFLRLETREGQNAWGCGVAHPGLTGEDPEAFIQTCHECADMAPNLHPTNIEYSLAELAPVAEKSPMALCAFDLAFHDLLGLAAGMPLYRLLGGYRNRIQTSVTIPIAPLEQSVEMACARAAKGYRMLKIKGGLDPEGDVYRIRAIRRALPRLSIRLDADGGYSAQQAIDVANALKDKIEMLEQPTPADDLESLREVTVHSPVPILADQSVAGPSSALELAAQRGADGMSVKLATCGGMQCARQIDAIARAAKMATMVSCVIEPALLIAAGLSFALSSPNVRYGDLDGNLDLVNDPTMAGFAQEDGWLIASDVPGLGCRVNLN